MLRAMVASLAIHAALIVVFASREPEPPAVARGSRVLAATISSGRAAVDGDDSGSALRRGLDDEPVRDIGAAAADQPAPTRNDTLTPESEPTPVPRESGGSDAEVGVGMVGAHTSSADEGYGALMPVGGFGAGDAPENAVPEDRVALRVEPPRPVERIVPEYPRIARRRGLEGEVVIQVTISVSGDPRVAEIVSPSDHRVLNDAAIAAVQGARFQPGRVGGQPTEMSLSIRIVFELS